MSTEKMDKAYNNEKQKMPDLPFEVVLMWKDGRPFPVIVPEFGLVEEADVDEYSNYVYAKRCLRKDKKVWDKYPEQLKTLRKMFHGVLELYGIVLAKPGETPPEGAAMKSNSE